MLAPAEAPPQLVLLPVDNLQTPAVRAAAAAAAAAEEAAAALGPASVAETEELASNPVERSLPQVSHVHVVVQGSWAPHCQHRSCRSCSTSTLTSWRSHQHCAQSHQAAPAHGCVTPTDMRHLCKVTCCLPARHCRHAQAALLCMLQVSLAHVCLSCAALQPHTMREMPMLFTYVRPQARPSHPPPYRPPAMLQFKAV